MTRCQICGRRRGLNKARVIVFHNVRGVPCPGAGFPSIGEDDGRLVSAIAEAAERSRAAYAKIAALEARRANWIDPALYRIGSDASALRDKLARRLKRHREWPARFERQMERHGYGDPPPQYLIDRERG